MRRILYNDRLLTVQASDAEADDGNLDACCLCGLGGNLLCCDGCPAAYHMRCIGEGAKSIPDGEWLCTECSLGGRGERHPWFRCTLAQGTRQPRGAVGSRVSACCMQRSLP
jgi:PHD-finger